MAEKTKNDEGKSMKKTGGATATGAAVGGVIGGIPGAITGAIIGLGASIFKALNDNK